jgi:hypothetical protein
MITNVTIDFLVPTYTSLTKITVIFAPMVTEVTTGRGCYVYASELQTFPSLFNTIQVPGCFRVSIKSHSSYDDRSIHFYPPN